MDTFVVGRIRGSLCLLLREMHVHEKGCKGGCPTVEIFFRPSLEKRRSLTPLAPLVHKRSIIKLHTPLGVDTLECVKRWYYIVLLAIGLGGAGYVYLHRQELGLAAQDRKRLV